MSNPIEQYTSGPGGPVDQLINDLAAPIFTWRMWRWLNRAGQEKALRNAAEKIDKIVTEYVDKKSYPALSYGLLMELLHIVDNGFMAPEVREERIARIRRMAEKIQESGA